MLFLFTTSIKKNYTALYDENYISTIQVEIFDVLKRVVINIDIIYMSV